MLLAYSGPIFEGLVCVCKKNGSNYIYDRYKKKAFSFKPCEGGTELTNIVCIFSSQ